MYWYKGIPNSHASLIKVYKYAQQTIITDYYGPRNIGIIKKGI
jgi:hypothetical protein